MLKTIRNYIVTLRDIYLVRVKYRRYTIGSGFHSQRGTNLWAKKNLIIGANFRIGRYSSIECDAIIGDNVMIGNDCSLIGRYDHNTEVIGVAMKNAPEIRDSDYDWKGLDSKIVVEDDVWIATKSIVMSGVTLGRGCIVAPGSVVMKNVAPYAIVAGYPARLVQYRFSEEQIEQHENILYK